MEDKDTRNPWLESLASLQRLIDAELLEISERDDGTPRVILMQDLYDAFFFSDFMDLNEDARWYDRVLLYMVALMRWLIRFIPPLRRRAEGYIRTLFHRRHWFDEPKALAFLEKVRFLINWRRGYVAGLRNYGQDELDPRSEEDMLRKLHIADEVWITFYVLSQDYKPLIIGRWKKDRFELKSWDRALRENGDGDDDTL